MGRSAWAFPAVGIVLGLLLFYVNWLGLLILPAGVSAVITVSVWIYLTGGLHLDGWTDCWDALGASVSSERRLAILKDSRLGSFGAMALFVILGLKVACIGSGLVSLSELLLACVTGRSLMVIGFMNTVGLKPGMAQSFLSGVDGNICKYVWLLTLPFVFIAGITGFIAFGAAFLGIQFFKSLARSRFGFINGDVLGASCELSETIVLIAACWS